MATGAPDVATSVIRSCADGGRDGHRSFGARHVPTEMPLTQGSLTTQDQSLVGLGIKVIAYTV